MPSSLPIEQFLAQAQQKPVVDVRSPKEFAQGHIPGAVNVPLFDDSERAKVGTKYKHAGKDAAVLLGLELVGPKLVPFVRQAKKIAPSGELLVHCWRGGMRSGSFAWLLNTAGMQVATLQQGYKAYRQVVLGSFEQPLSIIILGGKTGSGKTDLLRELARQGEQVVDLEGIAHHKGSSFGAIGELPQPTVEQFENDLHAALRQLNPHRRIWLEDESLNIGTVRLPLPLFHQMRQAPVVFIDVPPEIRIRRLVADYAGYDHVLLEDAVCRIKKRLGGLIFGQAMDALRAKNYAEVARLSLQYYDKAYLFGLSQREPHTVYSLPVTSDDEIGNARKLIAVADEMGGMVSRSAS